MSTTEEERSAKWSHQIKALQFRDTTMACIALSGSEVYMVIDSEPRQDVSWTRVVEHLIMED